MMEKIKLVIICMAALLVMAAAGCGFKHADSAKTSMHDVSQSAEDLKEETEASKQKTEDMKEQESMDTTQDHQW